MHLFRTLVNGVTDQKIGKRIFWLYVTFFGIFLFAIIIGYFILPEGFLRGKHPIVAHLDLSPDLLISMLQIFGYNVIPTVLIMASSLIAQQSRVNRDRFIPVGYWAFWGLVSLLGIYTGTWSFEVVTAAPPLGARLLQVFDIVHHSGLLEISAYLLAAAVSYRFTLWYSDRKKVVRSRKREEIKLAKSEWLCLVLVILLLICAAFIETYNIIQLAT